MQYVIDGPLQSRQVFGTLATAFSFSSPRTDAQRRTANLSTSQSLRALDDASPVISDERTNFQFRIRPSSESRAVYLRVRTRSKIPPPATWRTTSCSCQVVGLSSVFNPRTKNTSSQCSSVHFKSLFSTHERRTQEHFPYREECSLFVHPFPAEEHSRTVLGCSSVFLCVLAPLDSGSTVRNPL